MNWTRLALSAVGPFLVALPIAALLWRGRQATIGTVVGAAVILMGSVLFMAVEYGEAVRFRVLCAEENRPCPPSEPSDFVRIVSYAMVGMVQVMVVFVIGGWVEDRRQRRQRDPEWR
jgi:hypothetical protein